MEDLIEIVKSLEDSELLLKGFMYVIRYIGVSLLGNLLTGKGINKNSKGINGAGEGIVRAGEGHSTDF